MLRVKAYGISEIGSVRKNNEDNLYISGHFRNDNLNSKVFSKDLEKITDCGLFAVCDGMGGEAYGEEASWIAVSGLSFIENHLIRRPEVDFSSLISSYLRQANKRVCDRIKEHKGIRMGTTFASLCLRHDKFQVANLGDSRIYLYRNGELKQLTKDHTQAQNLADLGMISQDEVKTHPERHALIQHLGIFPQEFSLEPSVSEIDELHVGDKFLLCSDGLSEQLDDFEIEEIISENEGIDLISENLVSAAISSGGKDNITLILLEVVGINLVRLTQMHGGEDSEEGSEEISSFLNIADENSSLNNPNSHDKDNEPLDADTAPVPSIAHLNKLATTTKDTWKKNEQSASLKAEKINDALENKRQELLVKWPKLPSINEQNTIITASLNKNTLDTKYISESIDSIHISRVGVDSNDDTISNGVDTKYEFKDEGTRVVLFNQNSSDIKPLLDETRIRIEANKYNFIHNSYDKTLILPTAMNIINAEVESKSNNSNKEVVLYQQIPVQPITTDDLDRFNKAKIDAIKRQNRYRYTLPDSVRYGTGFKGHLRRILKIERNIYEVFEEYGKTEAELKIIKRKRLIVEIAKTIIYMLAFSLLAYFFYGALRILLNI